MIRALAVVGLGSSAGLALLTWYVVSGSIDAFDMALVETVQLHIGPQTRTLLLAFTRLGQGDVLTLATLAACIACLLRGHRLHAALWVVTMLAGYGLTQGMKSGVGRMRPRFAEEWLVMDHSFPSGHTSMTLVFVGLALYVFLHRPRPRWLALGMVAGAVAWSGLMGASRLLLGNHYLSDVLGGFLMGIGLLAICIVIAERHRPQPR